MSVILCDCCGKEVTEKQLQLGTLHPNEPDYKIVIINGHERHWVKVK